MIGQRLGEAAIDRKGPAPIAVLLSVGDHGRILIEAVKNRLEEGVAIGKYLRLRIGLAAFIEAETLLLLDRQEPRILVLREEHLGLSGIESIGRSVREHDRFDEGPVDARRDCRVDRKLQDPDDLVFCRGLRRVDLRIAEDPVLLEVLPVAFDCVGRFPEGKLLFGPIGGGVRRRVAGDAIRDGVQQNRPPSFEKDLHFARDGVGYGEGIVAVDALGVHVLLVDACPDAGEIR